ncbi:hypothetical protein POM88_018102 [Heracleum sosnowskyi]|uniref:Transposase-associated domain-containing protein n=1 Tax=Heracleum sosnowskyi TaxID=360622 RepID=A0AAD8IRS3_9APIA|nr:hypothetical protein POM88_018102 [Heracleum sosnowskyi]
MDGDYTSWIGFPKSSKAYVTGIIAFIENAFPVYRKGEEMKCPCKACVNRNWHLQNVILDHLICNGPSPLHVKWICEVAHTKVEGSDAFMDCETGTGSEDNFAGMGFEGNLAGMGFEDNLGEMFNCTGGRFRDLENEYEDLTNAEARKFYSHVREGKKPLYPGCTKFSRLSFMISLYHLKCLHGITESAFGELLGLLKDAFPDAHLPSSFNAAKNVIKDLDGQHLEIRPAVFDLTNKEKDMFCSVLKNAKLPYGCASNISRYVNTKERTVTGYKSHDAHFILHYMLPFAVKKTLKPLQKQKQMKLSKKSPDMGRRRSLRLSPNLLTSQPDASAMNVKGIVKRKLDLHIDSSGEECSEENDSITELAPPPPPRLTKYEEKRIAQMQQNDKKLEEFGIKKLVVQLNGTATQKGKGKEKNNQEECDDYIPENEDETQSDDTSERIKNAKKRKLLSGPQTRSRANATQTSSPANATQTSSRANAIADMKADKEVASSSRANLLQPTCSKLLKQSNQAEACGSLSAYLALRDRQKQGMLTPPTKNVHEPNLEKSAEEETEADEAVQELAKKNEARRASVTDTYTLGPNSMAQVREKLNQVKEKVAAGEDASELIANGKSHGREWLKGRHGKSSGSASTLAPVDPFIEDVTEKIKRDLEVELDAKLFNYFGLSLVLLGTLQYVA